MRQAVAVGSAPKWATFRQRRDVPNEHVEAQAQRVEYDGTTDTVRFVGQAVLRIVRGKVCNTATAFADGTDAVGSRACTTVRVGRRPATPVTG